MAKLVMGEGGKLVGVNKEGAVVFEVESLDDLKNAQLPKIRSKTKPRKIRPWPRWKDGSFFTDQQVRDESYQRRMGIA